MRWSVLDGAVHEQHGDECLNQRAVGCPCIIMRPRSAARSPRRTTSSLCMRRLRSRSRASRPPFSSSSRPPTRTAWRHSLDGPRARRIAAWPHGDACPASSISGRARWSLEARNHGPSVQPAYRDPARRRAVLATLCGEAGIVGEKHLHYGRAGT